MLEWLTGLLALMTGWLAWQTREMARATKQMASLSAEPFLTLAKVDLIPTRMISGPEGPQRDGYTLKLGLTNPGQVRVSYEVKQMLVSFEGKEYPPAKAFDNRGGFIHPKEEVIFTYPFFECASPFTAGLAGSVDFEARFWSVAEERKTFRFKLRYEVVAVSPTHRIVNWTYLEGGPSYA